MRRQSERANPAICAGSIVRILNTMTNAEEAFELVEPGRHDPAAGRISIESPVGKALIGLRKEQVAEVATPSGVRRLRVVDVTTPRR